VYDDGEKETVVEVTFGRW